MIERCYIINKCGERYLVSWYARDIFSDDPFRRFLKSIVKKEDLLNELEMFPDAFEYNEHIQPYIAQ